MLETLTCLKNWEDGHMKLQTLEDKLKKPFKKLDLNADNDVQEIDDDWRWKKKRMKIEWQDKNEYDNWRIICYSFLLNLLNVANF